MTINGTVDDGCSAFSREIKLDPEPASVRKARDFVRSNLCKLGFPGSVDNGVLIASELVTNAVREAPETPCLVAVRVGAGHPVLEVHDCCADLPEMRSPDFVAEGGRGLHIVDALSEEWDCVQSGGGKAVIVVLPR
jgi:anti-sigma regulatory factor (Ser/Thr protein kinase)